MMKHFLPMLALTLAGSASANTVVLMSNNFDAEAGGLTAGNYTGFSNLTVTAGTVDVVANGDYGLGCAGGSGSCVDLDGSTRESGNLATAYFAFNAGDTITWTFDLAGSQRGSDEDFFAGFEFTANTDITNYALNGTWGNVVIFPSITLSGVSTSTSIYNAAGYSSYGLSFTAAQAGMVRATLGSKNSDDNVGPLADNVLLTRSTVPEPASWGLMITGFGLTGAAMRRRERRLVAA